MTGFPYSLEINVHKAENLPASSLSLSETYVILSIEGAELGRTGFAVKNKVSYIWKEVFSTGLLHVAEGRITFSLFYFQESTSIDKGGEFIGKCDVGLPNLSRDGKPHFIRSPLVKTMEGEETETSSQGFLFFSVKLQVLQSISLSLSHTFIMSLIYIH